MATTQWRHLDDLPVEQLDAIIWREDSGVSDKPILGYAELPLRGYLHHHALLA
jgi:hypothetical protein